MTQAEYKVVRERLEWCLQRPASPEAAEELVAQLAAVDMLERAMVLHEAMHGDPNCNCANPQTCAGCKLLREWHGEGERG